MSSGVGTALAANVRQRREAAGLSLAELAALASIAKGTVTAVENGANPTVETVYSLAAALGCSMADLLADAPDPMLIEAIGERPLERLADMNGYFLQRFVPSGTVEVYDLVMTTKKKVTSAPHRHGVYEHIWVAEGLVEFGPSANPYELRRGDYVCYGGWVPHHYRALETPARVLMLLSYARSVPEQPLLGHLVNS